MADQLQTITLAAPGFFGLNTQDSPVTADDRFASIADNAIIDKFGRVGSRKGLNTLTSDSTPLGSSAGIEVVHEFESQTGTTTVYSAGNNKIFTGTSTLTDVTPGSYTITDNNWKMVNFNDHVYMFQRGYMPLVYGTGDTALHTMSTDANVQGTPPEGNEVLAAFGRLWVADLADDKTTVYWSDLLDGVSWSVGSAGSLDLTTVWPDGYDEITALAAHNNFLIIFGRNSIVVYQGATSPSTMSLADTIAGVGCIDRDTVQPTGDDLIFLSHKGLQSFGRVIQEQSLPQRDLSRNIRTDLINLIQSETTPLKSLYSPENAFYLLVLRDAQVVYCFDTRASLQDGSYRVTRWPASPFLCFESADDGTIYTGFSGGVGEYTGYLDDGNAYTMKWYSNPLDFEQTSRIKILKKINPTIIGGANVSAVFKWGYGYSPTYNSQAVALDSGSPSYYNIAEYNVGEYSGGIITSTPIVYGTGAGTLITVGVDVQISSESFSLQEIIIQVIFGKIV